LLYLFSIRDFTRRRDCRGIRLARVARPVTPTSGAGSVRAVPAAATIWSAATSAPTNTNTDTTPLNRTRRVINNRVPTFTGEGPRIELN
jgi:hypothetical protein